MAKRHSTLVGHEDSHDQTGGVSGSETPDTIQNAERRLIEGLRMVATDALIERSVLAGPITAALLATYRGDMPLLTKFNGLCCTPRAHITS